MKLKNIEVSKKKIRVRLIISLTVGLIFLSGIIFAFRQIQMSPKVSGAPKLLRDSYHWNEEVWKILSSNRRKTLATEKVPHGKKPRVNGMLGLKTPLDLEKYRLQIMSGKKELKLTVTELKMLTKTETSTHFRCVEGWSEDLAYGGVRFSDFIKQYQLGKKDDGTYYEYVALETPDGQYYVSLDMESMLHDQTLLSYEMNGMPLSMENGAPIRLLIPIKYGIKSLKRIGKIYFSDERPRDYWAERGYDWYSGL